MVILETVTLIAAPVAVCFELSLDLDIELESVEGLTAVAGVTHGRIGAGERVTWRTKQFGIPVRHTTEISGYEAPGYFQDRMVRGIFASFVHDHFFEEASGGGTRMRDRMRFAMPWFLGGVVTEALLVRRRMWAMLLRRNAVIKAHAEGGSAGWVGDARPGRACDADSLRE